MLRFLNLTLNGVGTGVVYAAVALALVLIWRSTRIVNFAQGGMMMISTFVAYSVLTETGSFWLGLGAALLAGLILGAVVELAERVDIPVPTCRTVLALVRARARTAGCYEG